MEKNANTILSAINEFEILYFQIQEIIRDKFFDDYWQVDENDYYKEDEEDSNEILYDFSEILIEFYNDLNFGRLFNAKKKMIKIKELMENELLSDILYQSFGKNGEEIYFNLYSIIENIDFSDFYENEILILPNNIKDLNEEILMQISSNPDFIHKIEPKLFEELMSKILNKFKIDTHITKRTRDGGIDIIGIEDNLFTKNNYIIECKRYSPKKKVSIDLVQRLYGIKQSNQATKAFLITSSSFTKPAIEWAKQHCWDLELKDYNDIKKWLQMFW